MATKKLVSKSQIAENKRRQNVLRNAGYSIKVDGSWGPWQQEQYNKVISSKGKAKKANVGALALPAAGLAASQVFQGLGSVSLPAVSLPSATALASAAPIALTLAGPAYGAYELATGQHHSMETTPQERQNRVYSSDATSVSRPMIPRTFTPKKSILIGEKYMNPSLANLSRVNLASTQANDSTGVAQRDSVGTSNTPQQPQRPENNQNNQNNQNKKKSEDDETMRGAINKSKQKWKKLGVKGVGFVSSPIGAALTVTGLTTGGIYGYNKLHKSPIEQKIDKINQTIKLEEAESKLDQVRAKRAKRTPIPVQQPQQIQQVQSPSDTVVLGQNYGANPGNQVTQSYNNIWDESLGDGQ